MKRLLLLLVVVLAGCYGWLHYARLRFNETAVAPDFPRRRLRELRVADEHALDPFVRRQGLATRFDLGPDHLLHERVVEGATLPLRERLECDQVGHDVRVHLFAPAAGVDTALDDDLEHVRGVRDLHFDLFGVDLLPRRGRDHVLQPPRDPDAPVAQHAPEITRVEPAVAQDFGRALGLAPVAEHHVRAAHGDLTVAVFVGPVDPHLDARHRPADSTRR